MAENEALEQLVSVGAVLIDDHFVYTSGKHGAVYVNKDALYPYTHKTSKICSLLAMHFKDDQIDTVIAPATGAIVLSQGVAHHLSFVCDRQVFGVYAEKADGTGGFAIGRGYDAFIARKRVLVVEDILTTGGSVKKVVEAVKLLGGIVVAVGAICNRGKVRVEDIGNVPRLVSLVQLTLDTWSEEDCPLCAKGTPINVAVGNGGAFLASKK